MKMLIDQSSRHHQGQSLTDQDTGILPFGGGYVD